MSAIALEGVRKSFGTHEVLRGIDLGLEEHEVVCLIGASGSGKSTLLRCVNLLEPLDAGRILLHGEEITRRGVDVNRIRQRIGIVFQAFNLFPPASARALRPRRQAERLPGPAVGRAAAASGDRPGAGNAP